MEQIQQNIIILPNMQSLEWQHARKHQTNSSSSKATFAFGRDSRFKRDSLALCDSFYNIPSKLGKAPASGIGKGSKSKIVNPNLNTPSPQNYNVKSCLFIGKEGSQFGLGRQKMKYNGIFNKSQTPEPGHYQNKSQFGNKSGFTIYSKLSLPTYSNSKNPGPSHYTSTDSFNRTGRYVMSQLTNCPGYKIKPGKPNIHNELTPGPGQYNSSVQNLNPNGKYITSKNENSRCRTFSRSSKTQKLKIKNPGPGSYNYVSQFGKKQ